MIHQKHAKLTKPDSGDFARNEIGILGTPCGNIKQLSYAIIEKLSTKYSVGYMDADHKGAEEEGHAVESALGHGASMEYIDKIQFHRFDFTQPLDKYQFQQHFSSQDLVIINGNHYKSKNQIIVIDSKKPLKKKLDKLTRVELVLLQEGETEIPEFIKDHLADIDSIPVYSIKEVDKVVNFIDRKLRWQTPQIKGLVLAGGKSTRMKKDKGKINYHGLEQRLFMYDLLSKVTLKSHLSIRNDQAKEFDSDVNVIEDKFIGLGPHGAILSAFQSDPNTAWLITACDQPFINKTTLDYLISKRNATKLATAFYNPETDFPEPLITLWEPKAYPQLLHFLSLGYSCPRKVLINSDIELIELDDPGVLKNANTPEEYDEFRLQLE